MKSKITKNKHLRQLVRNYEIELKRPHGLKLIDLTLKDLPDAMKPKIIFIGKTIHKEAGFISKYKGMQVVCAYGLFDKGVVITSQSPFQSQ